VKRHARVAVDTRHVLREETAHACRVVGSGYVGLWPGMSCGDRQRRRLVDVDAAKIERLKRTEIDLRAGPSHGARNQRAPAHLHDDIADAVQRSRVIFIAVEPRRRGRLRRLPHVLGRGTAIGKQHERA